MKLEEIGFYTLSENRAKNISINSPLYRAELILTDKCNFHCPYCRGLEHKGSMSFSHASSIINYLKKQNTKNIRFSGGEPTLYPNLKELIIQCRGMDHIAISTNGTAPLDYYFNLIKCGVNDFSISLDACCASTADKMSGNKGSFELVTRAILELAKRSYVTVGIVFNENNILELVDTIILASILGVSDIRVIPSAQYGTKLIEEIKKIPETIIEKYPILKYRINNFLSNNPIRGLNKNDCKRCYLAIDDLAIVGEYHYPCIIYLREKGKPIGKLTDSNKIRKDRFDWNMNHNCFEDEICRNNCLDVCKNLNQKIQEYHNYEN